MDKFVNRTPKIKQKSDRITSERPKSMKQVTLESLKRVVVMDDIIKSKSILSMPDQSTETILNELSKLRPKIPSVEVLQSTKLGVVLNRLTKHSDERVARSSLSLVNAWKADIRDRRTKPSIDVKSDAKTDRCRKDARRLISESFKKEKSAMAGNSKPSTSSMDSDELTNLVDEIERELFQAFNMKTSDAYRRSARKIVFALRHRSDLRRQVIDRKTSVNTLVMANLQK